MTTRSRAPARHTTAFRSGRLALLMVLVPLIGGLTIGSTTADRSLAVSALSAEDAQRQGAVVSIVTHPHLADGLAEVRVPSQVGATLPRRAFRLLALAPGARVAAVAEAIGPDPADLILARADGSQLRVAMPGLMAGSFSPDGRWLAVVDGAGALWKIGVDAGSAEPVAAGPFIGSPTIEDAGSILGLRVSSVEAPFVSRLVRIAADGSSVDPLTPDQLVYGMQPLDDGSLAVVAHQSSGTVVSRLGDGSVRRLLDLGPDAVHVAVARAGDAVAFERGGDVFLQRVHAGRPVRLATAGQPRFAADGRALLVETTGGSALIGLDGRTVAAFASQAAFAVCDRECGS